jgi:hypothetical protein
MHFSGAGAALPVDSATPPTAVGGVPLPAGGDRGEVAMCTKPQLEHPGPPTIGVVGQGLSGRDSLGRRNTSMRFANVLILAVLTCGCSVHIVEAPASAQSAVAPANVAPEPYASPQAPRAELTPRPQTHDLVRRPPSRAQPRPEPASGAHAEAPSPVTQRPSPVTQRPSSAAPRPVRVPARTTAPEPRPGGMARVPISPEHLAQPPRRHRPMKVKRPEPVAESASTGLAQAQ